MGTVLQGKSVINNNNHEDVRSSRSGLQQRPLPPSQGFQQCPCSHLQLTCKHPSRHLQGCCTCCLLQCCCSSSHLRDCFHPCFDLQHCCCQSSRICPAPGCQPHRDQLQQPYSLHCCLQRCFWTKVHCQEWTCPAYCQERS